jgi:acetyl-CoA acetyltransferase
MDVLITGIGLHPFGRFPLTVEELGRVAATEALADAGVTYQDVDLTIVANVREGMAKAQRVTGRLGTTGRPVISVESACASSAAALVAGRDAIESGRARIVLCLGVEKAPRGFIAGAGFEAWQEESGVAVTPIYFALQAQELLAATGGSTADLAAVSVKNHDNGALNPNAMYRSPVSVEQVLGSKMVCPPLNLLMLCTPNEGAAAVVLMSAEEARRRGVSGAVSIRSVALASRSPGDWFIPAPSRLSDERSSPTQTAATAAYAEAGLGAGDVDFVECQDTDAASELIAYADLGLCAPGDEIKLLRSGDTKLGGRIPVNPSGGLLSKGEPLGASGLGQIHELVLQLRAQAGPRQVEGARIGLAHVMGAGHVSSVTILAAA